jgi:hypothetical protein
MTRRLTLAALLVFYIALLALANHRHLWFDELYTFYIAQTPSVADFWRELCLDQNPPLYYLLARAVMALLGNTASAVRLPSMVAFLGASLCLFALIERRFKTSYAALAVLIFWSTPALYFATEARPYSLILGFFGLAMLSWSCSWSPLVLALAVAGMMLSHFFAIFFLVPFLFAETVRAFRSRRIDWPVIAALLLPCVIPFFFLKIPSGVVFPPAFQAGLRKMASYFYWSLYQEGWVLLIALCAALAVYRFLPRQQPTRMTYTAPEVAFVAGLLAIPLFVNAAMMILHGAFFTRYAAPTLFAFPLLLVAVLAASTNTGRIAALVMCGFLALYIPIQKLAKPIPPHPNFAPLYPELPFVAASGLSFLEMDHEQPAEVANRLYYLTDHEYALSYAHANLLEGLTEAAKWFPIRAHVAPFRAFVRDHSKFLVLGTPDYPEDWLLRYLLFIHAKLEFIGNFPSEYKDTELFLVEMPN